VNSYANYKSSGVEWLGNIPTHWDLVSFKHYIYFQEGPGIMAYDFENVGIPLIRISGVKGKYVTLEGCNYLLPEKVDIAWKQFRLEENDLLISCSASTGMVSRVFKEAIGAIPYTGLIRLKPLASNITIDFIEWLTQSDLYNEQINLLKTGATMQHYGPAHLKQIKITLPPVNEQKTIAQFLDERTAHIDTLIAKKQRLLDLLAEKRSALITQAVSKGLDPNVPLKPSGIAWLGDIPQHWEVKKFKFIVKNNFKYGANEAAESEDRDCPRFIRITDVNEDGTLKEDTFKSLPYEIAEPYLLEENDILLARSGATVGKTFKYNSSWGVSAFAGYLIRARLLKEVNSDFVFYFLRSKAYWEWVNSSFIQATIQNLSAEKYAGLVLTSPTVIEQSEIVEFLDQKLQKLDAVTTSLLAAIDKLKEYRTALIAAAVTGKIKVA